MGYVSGAIPAGVYETRMEKRVAVKLVEVSCEVYCERMREPDRGFARADEEVDA
jgi:hypothetical protein